MKKWNAPEMVELAIECTFDCCDEEHSSCNGNTPTTGATDKYKTKTNHCECGHNTNFAFCDVCSAFGNKDGNGSDTVTPDTLS